MGTLPYFIWQNKKSDTMGIIVNAYPPITRPKERIEMVTVPGRNGTMVMTEGESIYEPELRTLECTALPHANIEQLCAWLCGTGQAVFGNEPNRAYDARIINQIAFEKLLRGRSHRTFSVPFYCQPFKCLYPAAADIAITASGTNITNPGTMKASPIIAVYGSGEITLTIGFCTVILEDISGGILIDCMMQDCMTLDKSQLINYKMTGAFPNIPSGKSPIIWTGNVSRIVITPNWRYL